MNIEKIREIRSKLGWSQEKLAREINVTLCTVNRWENGVSVPNPRSMKVLDMLADMKLEGLTVKREAFRIKASCSIMLKFWDENETMNSESGDTTFFNATTEDLSSTGLMFRTRLLLSRGEKIRICWNFGKDKNLEVVSRVVWSFSKDCENHVGVVFDNPMPDVVSNVLNSIILH